MVRESFDIEFIIKSFPKVVQAIPLTLLMTALALLGGWLLGLVIAWGKVSGPKWLQWILKVITDIIRGIPTVVLLYLVYFGLPLLISAITSFDISGWNKLFFVATALIIELAISSSEMFRSAYSSIPKGQLEASHALGYGRWQRFIHVIFPQGVYVILPNLGSAILATIQATALVYTLGMFDILGKARQIDTNVSHVKTFEAYVICAIIYWGIAIIVGWIISIIEKRLSKGDSSVCRQATQNTKRKAAAG